MYGGILRDIQRDKAYGLSGWFPESSSTSVALADFPLWIGLHSITVVSNLGDLNNRDV